MDLYDLGRYNPNYWRWRMFQDQGLRNRFKYVSADTPIGYLEKMYENYQAMNDYLDNRGISWSDVKYPALMKGAGQTGYQMWQSDYKALDRLYNDDTERSRRRNMDNLREQHYRTAIDANNMRRAWYYSRM